MHTSSATKVGRNKILKYFKLIQKFSCSEPQHLKCILILTGAPVLHTRIKTEEMSSIDLQIDMKFLAIAVYYHSIPVAQLPTHPTLKSSSLTEEKTCLDYL